MASALAAASSACRSWSSGASLKPLPTSVAGVTASPARASGYCGSSRSACSNSARLPVVLLAAWPPPHGQAPHRQVDRPRVVGTFPEAAAALGLDQLDVERRRDPASDLVLQPAEIGEIAVEPIRPEMGPRLGV